MLPVIGPPCPRDDRSQPRSSVARAVVSRQPLTHDHEGAVEVSDLTVLCYTWSALPLMQNVFIFMKSSHSEHNNKRSVGYRTGRPLCVG